MDPVQLYHLLDRKPFQPVRVYLKGGQTIDIPSRELAVVGVTFLDIGFQATGAPKGIWGGHVTVLLQEIIRVEPPQGPSHN